MSYTPASALGEVPILNVVEGSNLSPPAVPSFVYSEYHRQYFGYRFDLNSWHPLDEVSGYMALFNLDADIADSMGLVAPTLGTDAALSATSPPAGFTQSLHVPGTGLGDCLLLPANSRFDFGQRDFCVEALFKTSTSHAYATLLSQRDVGFGPGSWVIAINGGSGDGMPRVYSYMYAGGVSPMLVSDTGGFNDGNWHHLAWERVGNDFTLYVDKVARATRNVPNASNPHVTHAIYVGNDEHDNSRVIEGYVARVALTVGIHRYNGTFPTDFPPITNLI